MKSKALRRTLLLVCCALLLTACAGEDRFTVTVITSGEHAIPSGEAWNADVYLLEGELTIESGASLDGRLVILSGSVQVGGTVAQDIFLLNGTLDLLPGARVVGPVQWAGGVLNRDPSAQLQVGVVEGAGGTLPLAEQPEVPLQTRLLTALMNASILAGLAWLVSRFAARQFARMDAALRDAPVVCTALGGLVFIVAPALFVTMAFTLILIPLVILGLFLSIFVAALGMAVIGARLAAIVENLFKREFPPSAATFLGTFAAGLIAYLLTAAGFPGTILLLIVLASGVGAVLLTRFGWIAYQRPL